MCYQSYKYNLKSAIGCRVVEINIMNSNKYVHFYTLNDTLISKIREIKDFESAYELHKQSNIDGKLHLYKLYLAYYNCKGNCEIIKQLPNIVESIATLDSITVYIGSTFLSDGIEAIRTNHWVSMSPIQESVKVTRFKAYNISQIKTASGYRGEISDENPKSKIREVTLSKKVTLRKAMKLFNMTLSQLFYKFGLSHEKVFMEVKSRNGGQLTLHLGKINNLDWGIIPSTKFSNDSFYNIGRYHLNPKDPFMR